MGACYCKSASAPETPGAHTRSATSVVSSATEDSAFTSIVRVISSIDKVGNIRDFYSVDSGKKATLGVGSSSTVSRGRNRSTKEQCAVKTISKAKAKKFERIKQEINIMRMLDHKNTVKLIDTFEDGRTIRLVMEMCTGGELSDRLIEAGRFTESQAAGLMQQIFQTVFYLHSKQICHRDIKPENLLFASTESIESSTLKFIDFGSACLFHKGQFMHTKAGSSSFVAPQVLFGKYDNASDLWSCGVIMHILLCGYPPFSGETEEDVLAKVRKGSFSFIAKDWKKVSEDAQILIRMLVKMSPQERYTAEQALNDTWIINKAPKARNESLDNASHLRRFQSGRKLKKAALHIIAEQLTESQIIDLDDIFGELDGDGDGMLNARELSDGLKRAGLKELPTDFQEIIEEVDVDSADTGVVDYRQFVAITLRKKQVMQETACWNAFMECGCDSEGNLTCADIHTVLGHNNVRQVMGEKAVVDVSDMIHTVEAADVVSFDEFMMMFKGPKEFQVTHCRTTDSLAVPYDRMRFRF
jgi:calcium-dependent protein kinase